MEPQCQTKGCHYNTLPGKTYCGGCGDLIKKGFLDEPGKGVNVVEKKQICEIQDCNNETLPKKRICKECQDLIENGNVLSAGSNIKKPAKNRRIPQNPAESHKRPPTYARRKCGNKGCDNAFDPSGPRNDFCPPCAEARKQARFDKLKKSNTKVRKTRKPPEKSVSVEPDDTIFRIKADYYKKCDELKALYVCLMKYGEYSEVGDIEPICLCNHEMEGL